MKYTDKYPVEKLIPYDHNPRKNEQAVDPVADSIAEFDFIDPIVVDENNIVLAGHTRLKAAKKLGLAAVPVIVADHLTPAQAKAYRIADNKTHEYARWDEELLNQELKELEGMGADVDIDSTAFNEIERAMVVPDDENPRVPIRYEKGEYSDEESEAHERSSVQLEHHTIIGCNSEEEKAELAELIGETDRLKRFYRWAEVKELLAQKE